MAAVARRTTIDVKTLLDNAGLRSGAQEAEGILSGLGGKVAAGVAVAAAAVGAVVVSSMKAAVEFESQMGQVFSLLPGISGEAMATMSDQVLDFSLTMGVLPDEVVPALYQALSSGIPQDNVFAFMETASKAAIGGNLEMTETVDLLSSAVNSYAEAGLTAAEASDVFFTTVRLGKTTMPELSAAFSNIGPLAATLGVGLDEVGASLAVLTLSGVPTATATTQIRAALAELAKSGTTAADAFEGITGDTFPEFMAAGGTFEEALAAMAASGDPVLDMFGSIEAAQAVMALTANNGEALAATMDQMAGSAGATDAAFAVMEDTTGRAMERLQANFEAAKIKIGEVFLPALASITDWAAEKWPAFEAAIRQGWEKLQPAFNAIGDAFGAVAALAQEHWPAIQATIQEVFETISALAEQYWPRIQEIITTVVEAITALVEEHWPQIQEIITSAIEAVQAVIERVTAIIQEVWERWGEEIFEFAATVWENIQDAIGGVLDMIHGTYLAFKALFTGDWQGLWDAVKQILDGAWTILLAALGALWAGMKLATAVAWDLIKTEVWTAIQAIPGVLAGAHLLLWQAARDLMVKAKEGFEWVLVQALTAIGNWLQDLPGEIGGYATDLYNAGLDLFGRLKDGLIDGLVGIAEAIADKVLGPLGAIYAKVAEIIRAVTGANISATGSVGGLGSAPPVDPNKAQEDALLAHIVDIRAGGGGTTQVKHGGGFVMPDWSTGTIVGTNEALVVAEVGEEVIPVGGRRGGGGPFIGVVNVLDRRTIAEELEVAWLMHGARMN